MARTTGAIRHTHRYYLDKSGRGRALWRCMKDGCTHFLPGNMGSPFGMKSDCWGCDKEFRLTHESLEQDKPMCEKCTNELNVINSLYLDTEETQEVVKCLSCRKNPVSTIGDICQECRTRIRGERQSRTQTQKVILVESESPASDEDKPESEYPLPADSITPQEKPRRTPEQQKLWDEQMKAYKQMIERTGDK